MRLHQSLTSLLIHDGLLMVARLFGMCLLPASLTLLLEFQILHRHYSDNGLFKGLVIKFSPHCIEICFSKVDVFFWYYISVFIENVIAWWSAILSVIFRFTISYSSVDKIRLNMQYCSAWWFHAHVVWGYYLQVMASVCWDFETDCREWWTWRLYKVTGQDFFFSCPLYFFPHSFSSSYSLPLFHCVISILLFPCESVWEKILMHEFPIFYSHTEWNMFSSVTNTLLWWRACYQKLNYKLQTKSVCWQVRELVSAVSNLCLED